MFVGVGFYSYMIGAVLGVMADFSEESTKYKGLMDELVRQLNKSANNHPIGGGSGGGQQEARRGAGGGNACMRRAPNTRS